MRIGTLVTSWSRSSTPTHSPNPNPEGRASDLHLSNILEQVLTLKRARNKEVMGADLHFTPCYSIM